MKNSNLFKFNRIFVATSIISAAAWLMAVPACTQDDDNEQTDPGQNFECTAQRDGWEQCLDNKVQSCHIVEGMEPHFHWGADCESLGYDCMELTQSTAACLDESSACTVGEFKCEGNSAYNCVDHEGHGHWAIVPCGTAKQCHEEQDEAHCEEESSDHEHDAHGHLLKLVKMDE